MEILQDTYTWITLSFLVFVFIVFKMGKAAFLNLLDTRIESIRAEIETAENLRVEAQSLLAQYQRKHSEAMKDAQRIVLTAEKQAEEIKRKAEIDLDETIKRREDQLKERLVRMEEAAKEEIRKHAASLAISATAEIIAEKLDKKTSERLVTDSLKSVSGNIH